MSDAAKREIVVARQNVRKHVRDVERRLRKKAYRRELHALLVAEARARDKSSADGERFEDNLARERKIGVAPEYLHSKARKRVDIDVFEHSRMEFNKELQAAKAEKVKQAKLADRKAKGLTGATTLLDPINKSIEHIPAQKLADDEIIDEAP